MKNKKAYMEDILKACEAFGWCAGFKEDPITENVEYMILGKDEQVKEIIRILEVKTKSTFDA